MKDSGGGAWLSCAVVLLAGVALAACKTAAPHGSEAVDRVPDPYLRIVESTNRVELQVALREFVARRGQHPAVWLVGVSHLGERAYYGRLQQHLDHQGRVLFEGIRDDEAPAGQGLGSSPSRSLPARDSGRGTLQSSMAAALGLVFQLEAIDYDRPHFVNSDLSIPELQRLMLENQPGAETGSDSALNELLALMQSESAFSGILRFGLGLVAASPRLQAWSRLTLIQVLGEVEGDPSNLPGMPADLKRLLEVLIQKRNERVIDDLRQNLEQTGPDSSIAIFYGGGHMPDLERRLLRLGFEPRQTVWQTAFSVNLAASGITVAERDTIRNLVKNMLAPAPAPAPASAP